MPYAGSGGGTLSNAPQKAAEPFTSNIAGGKKAPESMSVRADTNKEPEARPSYMNLQADMEIPQAERAGDQQVHQTYSLLKSEKRGLTDAQIDGYGFKSTPPGFLCRSLAERLQRQGCSLEGVPGFYLHDKGYWTIRFSSRASGILIPAIGIDGLIRGMQILLGGWTSRSGTRMTRRGKLGQNISGSPRRLRTVASPPAARCISQGTHSPERFMSRRGC